VICRYDPVGTRWPTIWGLDPTELADRFWAARGVCVVRQGEALVSAQADDRATADLDHDARPGDLATAELYLLVPRDRFVSFDLKRPLSRLGWMGAGLLEIEVVPPMDDAYADVVCVDDNDRFVRIERVYEKSDTQRVWVGLTPIAAVARVWRESPDPDAAARRIEELDLVENDATIRARGFVYDTADDEQVTDCVRHVVSSWAEPADVIPRARALECHGTGTAAARPARGDRNGNDAAGSDSESGGPSSRPARSYADAGPTWIDPTSTIEPDATIVGPVWIGAGRCIPRGASVVGPCVLWDDPASRPDAPPLAFPAPGAVARGDRRGSDGRIGSKKNGKSGGAHAHAAPRPALPVQCGPVGYCGKRLFDIAFALVVLTLSLPVMLVAAIVVWIEDGWPIFFSHTRETVGGRDFGCLKFRSMRRNAEEMKAKLIDESGADGPQFFMENDPRLTWSGRILRKTNIDELPQMLNVLAGHMSIVGPRPSPFSENQFNPAWRRARLSVRPGVTGLWQVMRTRQPGLDFQEWIRWDTEYSERVSFGLDLWILWRTFVVLTPRWLRTWPWREHEASGSGESTVTTDATRGAEADGDR